MNAARHAFHWTPGTVSWLSLFIVGVVVAGIGLSGNSYLVGYLHERMMAHSVQHNREIARRLQPLLAPRIEAGAETVTEALHEAITLYGTFGYRIFLVDHRDRLLADSRRQTRQPRQVAETWLDDAAGPGAPGHPGRLAAGAARATAEDGHSMLIWLEDIGADQANTPRWLLGVASDLQDLDDFLGELHWQLDGILLVSYLLVGLLGLGAVRGVGRAYERALEAQVRERTRALEAAHRNVLEKTRLATIGKTASVLAHEMRNPLASIKLALSGLNSQGDMPERSRRRVALVIGEVDRLEALLSQTLDFARPVQPSTRPVLLDQILSRVIEQQQPLLEERRLRVERQTCADCPALRLDEDKMFQVLLNLLKNAIEASPNDAEIGVSLYPGEHRDLVLRIVNGGEVLDSEAQAHAFEPFYTTKPRGSGLGLGLVRRIVEEHGGRVSLTSDRAAGTVVMIRLPLAAPAARGFDEALTNAPLR